MFLVVLIGLFVSVYSDCVFLKRKDFSLYQKTIVLPAWIWSILIISPLFVVSLLHLLKGKIDLNRDVWDPMFITLMILILGIYLARRFYFRSQAGLVTEGINIPSIDLISDSLGVILFGLFGIGVVEMFLKIVMLYFPQSIGELSEALISTAFSLSLMIYLIYITINRYPNQRFKEFVALNRTSQPAWITVWLPIVIGSIIAICISYTLINRPTQPNTPLREIVESSTSLVPIVGLLFMAVLVAPLFEEIIFRGYFYKVLNLVKGKWVAIIVVSFVFGFLHVAQYAGDVFAIVMIFILGFILTFLRAITGTTIASVVMHYTFNCGMTIFPIIIIMLSNPAFLDYKINYDQLSVSQKEELLLESIEVYPEIFVEAYDELAQLYLNDRQEPEKALRYINQALEISPKSKKFKVTKQKILESYD